MLIQETNGATQLMHRWPCLPGVNAADKKHLGLDSVCCLHAALCSLISSCFVAVTQRNNSAMLLLKYSYGFHGCNASQFIVEFGACKSFACFLDFPT